MIKPTALAVFITIAAFALPAAADVAAARAHYERGQALYQLGEYQRALDEFKAAHIEKSDPAFLYNIAQCYRQIGDRPNALVFYKRYLSLAPDSPLGLDVERRIRELETSPAPTVPATPTPVTATPHRSIKMEAEQAPGTSDLAVTARSGSNRLPLPHWVPIAGAAATVAFAATAIAFGVTASSHFNSLRTSCGATPAGCSQSQIDSVTSPAHVANVFWALTGVAAVGTGVSAYLNAREGGVSALWRF